MTQEHWQYLKYDTIKEVQMKDNSWDMTQEGSTILDINLVRWWILKIILFFKKNIKYLIKEIITINI